MDSTKTKGQINIKLVRNGKVILDKLVNNSIMNVGFAAMAGLVGNTGAIAAFTYLALGTSNTAVSAGQTALGAEISTNGLQRVSATVSRVTTTQTNDTLQLTNTYTVTGTSAIEEIGAFNASSSGIMLGRALTGTVNVINGDSLTMTYKFKFS